MAYIGKEPGSGLRGRFVYTATTGQTSFTGSDSLGRTLTYTDGEYTDVFLNGVKLDKTDYTATSGTSIVLDSGASADDTLEILAFDTFGLFSGEFAQDVSVGGDLTVDTSTLKVDSANNRVGVGVASPDALLHVQDVAASTATHSYTKVHIEDSDHLALQFSGGTSGETWIWFADDSTATPVGGITYYHGGPYMAFRVEGSNRAVIDSSGRLLVGKAAADSGVAGVEARNTGETFATASGTAPLYAHRLSDDGAVVNIQQGGSTDGQINSVSGDIAIGSGDTALKFESSTDAIKPFSVTSNGSRDNAIDLGTSGARYDDIYATNGTIQTSDQNEKQDIASLTSAEITAAKAISKLFKTFKWKSKVTSKGDNARTHAGVIAQEVQSAMSDAGLDVTKYAFWCSDTWWEKDVEVPAVEAVDAVKEKYTDEDGNEVETTITPAVEAQDAYTRTDTYNTRDEAPEGATERTRLGIRYPELLAFVGAATEQRLADIETRLAALEAE